MTNNKLLRAEQTKLAAVVANALCGLVAAAGAVVMLGWLLDIPALKSVHPAWVTMKFITAFSFVLSGVTIYCVARIARGEHVWAQLLLPGLVLALLLPMAGLLAGSVLGLNVGLSELFVHEASGVALTVAPGRPSIMTMVCFTLVAAVGLAAMFAPGGTPRLWRIAGAVLAAIGAVALFGYARGAPLYYFYWENHSTAMAAHTALLFVLLGAALWLNAAGIGGEQ